MSSKYDNIPEEMKQRRMWCCWRLEPGEDGKPTKIPRKANGGARVKSDEPSGWATFDEAVAASPRYQGIEVIISKQDPYTVIDLDHCVDESGKIERWAQRLIDDFGTYAEFSQSGSGIHIIMHGDKPGPRCRIKDYPNIEVYDWGRPLVMTGNLLPGNDGIIRACPNQLTELYVKLFGEADKQQSLPIDGNQTTTDYSDDELIDMAMRNKETGASFSRLWSGDCSDYLKANGSPDESAGDQALCNKLAFWTNRDASRIDRLFRMSGLMRAKWDRPDYRDKTVSKAIADTRNGFTGKKRGRPRKSKTTRESLYETPVYDDNLPEIVVSNRQLRDITAESIAAMEVGNKPESLFIRAGSLVRLRGSETDEGVVTIIDTATTNIIRCRMSQTANYIKLTRDGNPISVPPPEDNAKDVLAVGEWPFPPLDAVVATPVVRQDGTILTEPGYDRATRLFYRPEESFGLPTIPDKPTEDDVSTARAVIHDVIADFPFLSTADYANAVGMMLTPICRAAIQGCVPLAVVNAPQPGAGKGLLTTVCHIIATGREPAMMTAPDNREEWRKTITAQLMQGNTFVVIDNVEHKLFDASLASVLTLTRWTDRLLGSNKTVEVPNRACFIATGNNIKLGGDIPRRCYWVSINPCTSRPELRNGFRHSVLPDFVKRSRGSIVAALLTLARAWFVAGCPVPSTPIIGSYTEWSRVIGGILQHAGISDFLGNAEERRKDASEDDIAWEGFLSAIRDTWGTSQFTTQDVESHCEVDMQFVEILPDFLAEARRNPKISFARKLGAAFGKYSGKCFGEDDIKIEKTDYKAQNKAHWLVMTNQNRAQVSHGYSISSPSHGKTDKSLDNVF